MKETSFPPVTVITVNFNGRKFLKDLFMSIHALDYPAGLFRTIMVDNGSDDGSCEFVKENFPWVDIVRLERNAGYAGGNNAGIKKADGQYVALINNDCTVDRSWLKELVKTALSLDNGRLAAVSSKVLFFYKYLPVEILLEGAGRCKIFGIKIEAAGNDSDTGGSGNEGFARSGTDPVNSIKFLSGCSCLAKEPDGRMSFYTGFYSLLGIPIPDTEKDTEVEFNILPGDLPDPDSLRIKIIMKNISSEAPEVQSAEIRTAIDASDDAVVAQFHKAGDYSVAGDGSLKAKFTVSRQLYVYARDVINSCGIEINRSFYARDRGSDNFDMGQFDRIEEIFSPSGSSLLINRKMLEDTGLFDGRFFTYYEDVDIFWRARLAGWGCYFNPAAVARHYHCGTSVEWSYSFTYYVLRNRLLAIFRCGWPMLLLKSLSGFVISAFKNLIFWFFLILKGKRPERPDIKARLKVFFDLFYLLPANSVSRLRIRAGARVKDSSIKKLLINF